MENQTESEYKNGYENHDGKVHRNCYILSVWSPSIAISNNPRSMSIQTLSYNRIHIRIIKKSTDRILTEAE